MISLKKVEEGLNIDDLEIISYLIAFLVLQIGINIPFYIICLLPNSDRFASLYNIFEWTVSSSGDFLWPITITVFSQLIVNFLIVKFWKIKKISKPSRRHWILSYTLFILIIVVVTIFVSLIFPRFQELFLWPWIGLFLSSLGLYGFLYGLSITFLTIFALIFRFHFRAFKSLSITWQK